MAKAVWIIPNDLRSYLIDQMNQGKHIVWFTPLHAYCADLYYRFVDDLKFQSYQSWRQDAVIQVSAGGSICFKRSFDDFWGAMFDIIVVDTRYGYGFDLLHPEFIRATEPYYIEVIVTEMRNYQWQAYKLKETAEPFGYE